jgi:hypothetical protein
MNRENGSLSTQHCLIGVKESRHGGEYSTIGASNIVCIARGGGSSAARVSSTSTRVFLVLLYGEADYRSLSHQKKLSLSLSFWALLVGHIVDCLHHESRCAKDK